MRKLQTLVLALVLLSIVPTLARATALETSGEFRARGWWLDNYLKSGAATEFWDQRLRLGLTWPVAEGVRFNVRADILEGLWGENSGTSPTVSGAPAAGGQQSASPGTGTAKQAIAFDWVNLQFLVPGSPLRVTVGRQDVTWGTGYWVRADERDRLQVAAKLDPVVIVVAYDKFTEVFLGHDTRDDMRGWAIGAVADAAGFRFGLLAAYLKDESRVRFPAGDLSYVAGDFFATGALGPLSLKGEINVGSGKVDRGAIGDLDARGLGGYAGLFLPVGPAVTLGLEGAYARGDEQLTTGKNEGFFAADYQGPYWSVLFYNNLDYAGYAGDSQTSSTDLDVSVKNAASGKFSAVFAPTRKFSITAAGLYAAADQTKDGVDKDMGWEFDLVAAFSFTENTSLTAGVGYAVLGDYWKTASISGGSGRKPDNPLGGVVAVSARF